MVGRSPVLLLRTPRHRWSIRSRSQPIGTGGQTLAHTDAQMGWQTHAPLVRTRPDVTFRTPLSSWRTRGRALEVPPLYATWRGRRRRLSPTEIRLPTPVCQTGSSGTYLEVYTHGGGTQGHLVLYIRRAFCLGELDTPAVCRHVFPTVICPLERRVLVGMTCAGSQPSSQTFSNPGPFHAHHSA